MEKFTIAQLTLADLERVVDLHEQSGIKHPWMQVDTITLTADELRRVDDIRTNLVGWIYIKMS